MPLPAGHIMPLGRCKRGEKCPLGAACILAPVKAQQGGGALRGRRLSPSLDKTKRGAGSSKLGEGTIRNSGTVPGTP